MKAEPKYIVTMGININDNPVSWSKLLLNGKKSIETRNTNSLRPYIGKVMGVIRTGVGKAQLVGFIRLSEPIVYTTVEQFRADCDKHCILPYSEYDLQQGKKKYGYPVEVIKVLDESIPINSLGIVARKIPMYEIYL